MLLYIGKNVSFKEPIIVDPGLPPNQEFRTVKFGGEAVQGVVWQPEHVSPFHTYEDWSKVHFNEAAGWYNRTSAPVTNESATLQDAEFLHRRVFKKDPDQMWIDMSCGTGRHAFMLMARGMVKRAIGMEPIAAPLQAAQQRAVEMRLRNQSAPEFMLQSEVLHDQYVGRADVVTLLFNSLGYTFNKEDDLVRLKTMVLYLKPEGTLVLDMRSHAYEKQHYGRCPVEVVEEIKSPVTNEMARVTTVKYFYNDILGATEKIVVGDSTIAQHTAYGWRGYSIEDMVVNLQRIGCELEEIVEDRYTPEGELGERVWFIIRRTSKSI